MSALDVVRARGEALTSEIARAHYMAYAGLAADAPLAEIYARHARAYDDDAFGAALDAWRGAAAPGDARRAAEAGGARALVEWLVETRVARELAPLEEREIEWERRAVVRRGDGSTLPYQRAPIELRNLATRAERLELDAARAGLVARELAPLREERLRREHDLVDAAGIADGYLPTFQALTGIDVQALGDACRALLRDTQGMWDDVSAVALRSLGVPRSEAWRSDFLALLRAPQFDDAFPGGALEVTVRLQVEAMGLDPHAGGRVRYDTGERDGKRARAFCAPVRVPDEVYLVTRPQGGQSDWRAFLHELGHALHFANADPALPFEHRWLGDNSVTEGYAMLFDHLLQDAGWLRRYTELRGERLAAAVRAAAFEELFFLRRYCGKLLYELQLHGGEVAWSALPDAYVETLGAALGARHHAADAFADVDPRLYVTRYLRAWQLQAVLGATLRERFDEDWFRNPRSGPWIRTELFEAGQREGADELATRVAGATLDFEPLIASIEAGLS